MRTESLIEQLSGTAGPADKNRAFKRLCLTGLVGIGFSAAFSIALIALGVESPFNPHVAWWKLLYAGSLALAAGWLTARLSRPLAHTAVPRRAVIAVVAVIAGAGLLTLFTAEPAARFSLVVGQTWAVCPWLILLMAIPALGAAFWALRALAPTQPKQAGFAAGIFAGALGAFGYSIACPEASIMFVAVWYTLGVTLAGMLGRLLGPLCLRWK